MKERGTEEKRERVMYMGLCLLSICRDRGFIIMIGSEHYKVLSLLWYMWYHSQAFGAAADLTDLTINILEVHDDSWKSF